jgi:Flp pilus assembly protein TadD
MHTPFREELERICRSEAFQTAPRLRDLLVFLTSPGAPGGLKETVIGMEFFGRDPGYDPKKDPIVRVEAHRLRRRLLAYYSGEGAGELWRVDLPKGTYSPLWRRRDQVPLEWRLAVMVTAADDLTAEGLTVELINKLGALHGITVVAPHSSLATRDAASAVQKLGANAILQCRLDGLSLQASLSRADFSGLTPMGVFDNTIQHTVDALSRFVASRLGASQEAGATPSRRVVDRESFQLYLSGRAWFHRWSPDNLAQAASHFEQVVHRCPDFAPAYAGLADIHVLLGYWHSTNARVTLERGRAYASKALELDTNCAEAYCSMAAFEATLNRDWAASEALFRRALDARPSNALALNWLSIVALVPKMRFEEAVDAVFAAYDLDPGSPEIGNEIVWVRLCCGQFEESAEQGRRIVDLHPNFLEAYWSLGLAESALGRYSQACEAFDKAEQLGPDLPFTLALRGYAEGVGGNLVASSGSLLRTRRRDVLSSSNSVI